MLLDVVIDPLAVRGDRWFLGRIFFYPDGGIYFGVPLSNFAGWVVVGTLGVGGFACWSGWREAGLGRGWPVLGGRGSDTPAQPARQGRPWPGVALYYAVFCFNLAVTAWIGEWMLVMVGTTVHLATALALWSVSQRPAEGLGLEKQQA
jgi:putative membrane protein